MTIRALGFLSLLLATFGPSATLFAQDQNVRAGGYQVLPGDMLRVSVWKEPDLQMDVLVRPDSAISFPLAGEISTKGLSVGALQQELNKRLGKFISNPVVTVSVLQVLGNKVYVIGQVNDPGVFVVNPNPDVMQALSMAGGMTAFAASGDIKILRRNDAHQVAIPFDYNDVLKGKNLDQNIVLQSGDIVVVP
jgi:polysaccharide biosynthesis/export protein